MDKANGETPLERVERKIREIPPGEVIETIQVVPNPPNVLGGVLEDLMLAVWRLSSVQDWVTEQHAKMVEGKLGPFSAAVLDDGTVIPPRKEPHPHPGHFEITISLRTTGPDLKLRCRFTGEEKYFTKEIWATAVEAKDLSLS
jgi:hypothetical protein